MTAAQTLLSNAIDYAGMFWPAKLNLDATVANYAAYRTGADAWALGRLVLPIAQAAEFASRWPAYARTWPIAYVTGVEVPTRVPLKPADAAEFSPMSSAELERMRAIPGNGAIFAELLAENSLDTDFTLLSLNHLQGKLRTGGPGPDHFPSSAQAAAFLAAAVRHRVAVKATAGLHHALRGVHAIGDAPHASEVSMHGFVNLFLAAALLAGGGDERTATILLNETDATTFRFAAEEANWRDVPFSLAQLRAMRSDVLVSFGCCSFTDPLDDMRARGWLQ